MTRTRLRPGSKFAPVGLIAAVAISTSTLFGCTTSTAAPEQPATSKPVSSTTGPSASDPTTPDASSSSPATTPARPPGGTVEVDTLRWRLPQPVAREAAVTDPHEPRGVVVAGGLTAGDQSTASTYRLDLSTGQARTLQDLPVPVHDVGGAWGGGRELVLGGGNATEQDVVQARLPDGPWRLTGRLPSPRSDLAAVSIAGHVYVVGGYAGTTPALPDVLVRTSGRRWKVICQLPVPVRYAAVAVAQGAIWVIGGERNAAMVDAIQRIDLNTGRVRVVGHLSSPLGHAAAATFGSRILIIGGRTGPDTMSSTLWWFDPGSHELRRAGALPTPLADSAVVTRRHFAYLVGGETPQLSDRVLRVTVR